jgi:hypothetical protein
MRSNIKSGEHCQKPGANARFPDWLKRSTLKSLEWLTLRITSYALIRSKNHEINNLRENTEAVREEDIPEVTKRSVRLSGREKRSLLQSDFGIPYTSS